MKDIWCLLVSFCLACFQVKKGHFLRFLGVFWGFSRLFASLYGWLCAIFSQPISLNLTLNSFIPLFIGYLYPISLYLIPRTLPYHKEYFVALGIIQILYFMVYFLFLAYSVITLNYNILCSFKLSAMGFKISS